MPEPNTLFGDDSRPDIRPVYCYAVRQLGISDVEPLFLTQHDGEIEISGLPARFDAADPQAFEPANIAHGPIRRDGTFDKASFELRALTADTSGLSRYALSGALPRIRVEILKINPGRVIAGETAVFGEDTITVQSGLMSAFGFRGFTIVVEAIPEPLFSSQEIPRWRFSRTCNRTLYGVGCNVDPATFQLATNILALDPGTRQILIQGTHADEAGGYFRQGVLEHQPSGIRLAIFDSQISGTDTLLTLHQWTPDMAVTDVVVARAGCRHTIGDCRDKFANLPNFGGFSEVPNKNPTIHGV